MKMSCTYFPEEANILQEFYCLFANCLVDRAHLAVLATQSTDTNNGFDNDRQWKIHDYMSLLHFAKNEPINQS